MKDFLTIGVVSPEASPEPQKSQFPNFLSDGFFIEM
jgi:hypothetical protein